ncbi:tetratricopeptide repeat protein [Streptomyces sp. NPDC050743]|uniref:tetratricopeptide repeat protein n=1 Tax=Streptomyces sp. NPDC050743 TaxID=3365634 RepID=UPI00379FCF66
MGESGAERDERIRALLAVPALSGPEELPSVADTDGYGELGVSRSLYSRGEQDPYVRRPWVDDALDSALRDKDFVLLAGGSKAGRWRTAWEAVRRTLPGARLLVPQPGVAALAELLCLEPPLRAGGAGAVVVWLDHLERYLGIAHGIDGAQLDRLRSLAPRVVLLATVESNVREHLLSAEGRLGPTARLVLDQAAMVVVPSEPSARNETAEAEPQSADGELTGGAALLEQRWQQGLQAEGDEAAGLGSVLVRAAVDWRRMGLFRPVTEAELRELAEFDPRFPAPEPDAGTRWAEALRWALTVPAEATAALLEEVRPAPGPTAGRAFRAAAFLVSRADQPEVPPAAWEFALRRCDAFELMAVAETARTSGMTQVAESALRQAQRSAEPLIASYAGFRLGSDLEKRGDTSGAHGAYRQAVADGGIHNGVRTERHETPDEARGTRRGARADSMMAAMACVNLAQSLAEQGRTAEAIAACRQAIDMDDPIGTALAAQNLAGLLRRQGDTVAARSAYEQALAACTWHGDPAGLRGMVAADLGALLAEQGETAAALIALEVAVDSGHRLAAPRAAARMGLLLSERGDTEQAVAAFRLAAEAGEPEPAAAARLQLAVMTEKTDPEQAADLYRRTATWGIPRLTGLALCGLGALLSGRGDVSGAVRAYREAIEPGRTDPGSAARAALRLGMLLEKQRDPDGALSAYREAMRSGDPESAPPGAYGAGCVLERRGDFRGARDAFRQAARSGHPRVAAWSLVLLGDVLVRLGDPQGAGSALERAARSADPDVRQAALERIDRLPRGPGPDGTAAGTTEPPYGDV